MSRALIILSICFLGSVLSQIPVQYGSSVQTDLNILYDPSSFRPHQLQLGATNIIRFLASTEENYSIGKIVYGLYYNFYDDNNHKQLIGHDVIIFHKNAVKSGTNFKVKFPLKLSSNLEKGPYLLIVDIFDEENVKRNFFFANFTV